MTITATQYWWQLSQNPDLVVILRCSYYTHKIWRKIFRYFSFLSQKFWVTSIANKIVIRWKKVQLVYFDLRFHFNPSALKRNVLVWILTTICFPFATFWFRYYLPWSFHIVHRPSSSILMTYPSRTVHFQFFLAIIP